MEKNNSAPAMGSDKTPGEISSEDHSEATPSDLDGKFLNDFYADAGIIIYSHFLEFENVSAEIDNLNAFLDTMESNVDNIKDQLLSILMSNREILTELKEENKKTAQSKESNESEVSGVSEENKSMDTS